MENENNIMQGMETEETVEVKTEPVAEIRCPKCQAALGAEQAFCPECGTAIKSFCNSCGAELQPGQGFCASCGQRVADSAPAAPNQFGMPVNQPQKNRKPLVIVCAVVAVIVVLALIGGVGGGFSFDKEFSDIAYEEWCYISSDGSYMKLDTNPDNIDSDSYKFDYNTFVEANEAIQRVNKELGFSSSLYEKMNTTTWSQGKQFDENSKFKVNWTYHPDKGLEVMYEKK